MTTHPVRSQSARISELSLSAPTLVVEDDELSPFVWARVVPEDRSSALPPEPRAFSPSLPARAAPERDDTLAVADEELYPVVFAHPRARLSEAPQGAPAKPATSNARQPPTSLLGHIIDGRYKLRALIGRGGMGLVYEAEHSPSGRRVAVKVLMREGTRPEVVERFRREARVTSQLRHPSTVRVLACGEREDLLYLVMEHLEGRDLATLLRKEKRLPYRRAVAIACEVCAAVAKAHALGVIHRDLKPENIFVLKGSRRRARVKVLDFGIAELREDDAADTGVRPIMGTPHYMAPEQIRGEPLSERTDVYALAATLYKAITGHAPFVAATPLEVLERHLNAPLIPMRERVRGLKVPGALETVLARAMEKAPEKRYGSMRELKKALIKAVRGKAAPRGGQRKKRR